MTSPRTPLAVGIAARKADTWAAYEHDNARANRAYERRLAWLEQIDRETRRVRAATRTGVARR